MKRTLHFLHESNQAKGEFMLQIKRAKRLKSNKACEAPA